MTLIIDGYNLLHVTGISGGGGKHSFQRSREALLNFLAEALPAEERVQTTIVFDAAEAPPGLPRTLSHQGMTVRYAADYMDADALIEQLIREHTAPRSLLVVSSDHRIQRAAGRRRAAWIDSDRWYAELWQQRLEARSTAEVGQFDKPFTQLTPGEIEYWVARFAPESPDLGTESAEPNQPSPEASPEFPFPEGYADDLWEDADKSDFEDLR